MRNKPSLSSPVMVPLLKLSAITQPLNVSTEHSKMHIVPSHCLKLRFLFVLCFIPQNPFCLVFFKTPYIFYIALYLF